MTGRMTPDNQLEGISVHIEGEILEWMRDTAKTAKDRDQVNALVSGVMGGVVQFCLEAKSDALSARDIGNSLAVVLATLCAQADHKPSGATVQ